MPFFCKKKRAKSTERFRPVPHLPVSDAPPLRKKLPSGAGEEKTSPPFWKAAREARAAYPHLPHLREKTAPVRAAFGEKRTLLRKNA